MDGAVLDWLQSVDAFDERAFARSGRAADDDRLAAFDREGAIAKDLMVPEPFTDRLDGNHRPSCFLKK